MNDRGQVRAIPGRSIHIIREKDGGWSFVVLNRNGREFHDMGIRCSAERFEDLINLILKYVDVDAAAPTRFRREKEGQLTSKNLA
jgi:hypothetical protein